VDLGIAGGKAIVCASSRALGRACAKARAKADCEVAINGRDREQLAATPAELHRATGAKITPVAADVAAADGQRTLSSARSCRRSPKLPGSSLRQRQPPDPAKPASRSPRRESGGPV
jgi:short-subunit dehydrogenase